MWEPARVFTHLNHRANRIPPRSPAAEAPAPPACPGPAHRPAVPPTPRGAGVPPPPGLRLLEPRPPLRIPLPRPPPPSRPTSSAPPSLPSLPSLLSLPRARWRHPGPFPKNTLPGCGACWASARMRTKKSHLSPHGVGVGTRRRAPCCPHAPHGGSRGTPVPLTPILSGSGDSNGSPRKGIFPVETKALTLGTPTPKRTKSGVSKSSLHPHNNSRTVPAP